MGNIIEQKIKYKNNSTIYTSFSTGKASVAKDTGMIATAHGALVYVRASGRQFDITNIVGYEGEKDEDDYQVTKCVLANDGKYLYTAVRCNVVRKWDLETNTLVHGWKAHDSPILGLVVSSNSNILLTVSSDHTIKVWDTLNNEKLLARLSGHTGVIETVTFGTFGDDEVIASGDSKGTVITWNASQWKAIGTYKNHESVVTGIEFISKENDISPEDLLVTTSRDRLICVWGIGSGKLFKNYSTSTSLEALKVRFDGNNGYTAITGDAEGVVREWSLSKGVILREFIDEFKSDSHIITQIERMPTGEWLKSTSDNNITLWSDETFEQTSIIVGYTQEVTDVGILSESPLLIAVGSNDALLKIYGEKDIWILSGHTDMIMSIATSKESGIVVTGSKDGTARVWKLSRHADGTVSMRCIAVCLGHYGAITATAMTTKKTGRMVVTAGVDSMVKGWTLPDDDILEKVIEPIELVADYTLKAHEKDINAIAVSFNSKVFATGSQDKSIKLWDLRTGASLGILEDHKRGVLSLCFSSKENILMSSSADKTIRLWSVNKMKCTQTLQSHDNNVLRAIFTNNATQAVSVDTAGIMKIWDIKGECLETYEAHDDKIWALAESGDGDVLITGSCDSTIKYWKDITLELTQELVSQKAKDKQNELEFEHYIRKKDYKGAIFLAIQLNRPFTLLKLLQDIMDMPFDAESISGHKDVDDFITSLDSERLETFLNFICNWNTKNENVRVCQNILYLIFSTMSDERLLMVPTLPTIIRSLKPYTAKHYDRLDDAEIKLHYIDYTKSRLGA